MPQFLDKSEARFALPNIFGIDDLISGGLSIGAALLGGSSNKKATDKAVDASNAATEKQLELQKQQYDQTRADLSPYAQAGQTGLNALEDRATGSGGVYGNNVNPTYQAPAAFTYGADEYKASPGYEWQLQQGLGAIQSSQAARGALYSGATQKALAKYTAGLAAQDFNQERGVAYQQYNDNANRARTTYADDRDYLTNTYNTQSNLQSNLAGIGQNAAAGTSAAGANYAANAGNAYQANASNIGNAALANSANFSGLLGQGLNAYAYGQGKNGIVNGLVGGTLPKANGAANAYASSGYFA